MLFTVPLSYTFQGVSIPFIQLIMRGDILVIAPLVDIAFSRRVRWWSWCALGMVLVAMVVTLTDRGGLKLPPLAILTVVLYTIGYFMRLAVMTRIGKNGDEARGAALFRRGEDRRAAAVDRCSSRRFRPRGLAGRRANCAGASSMSGAIRRSGR